MLSFFQWHQNSTLHLTTRPACFLGVSLALYYNLTIKQGWSESKMKRRKAAWFLIVPPIVIGFLYAGIGIPYYDNVLVCHFLS